MKQNKKRPNLFAQLGILASLTAASQSFAGHLPDYQRVLHAQQRAHQLISETQRLIRVASGQGESRSCRTLSYTMCIQSQGCSWQSIAQGERGLCVNAPRFEIQESSSVNELNDDDNNENDNLAALGLQTLSQSMLGMSNWIDLLALNYGTPAAFGYHISACESARENQLGTIGVRGAAALPMSGMIQPSDLDPIANELLAVKADLGCIF